MTPIAPALVVASAADVSWHEEADVLVVGWGAAGASAAIEARSQGADVIVIDRFSGGGASALSGGVVYAGGGTVYQQQAGYDDSPQAMADYLRHEVNGVVSDDTVQKFCNESTRCDYLAFGLDSFRYIRHLRQLLMAEYVEPIRHELRVKRWTDRRSSRHVRHCTRSPPRPRERDMPLQSQLSVHWLNAETREHEVDETAPQRGYSPADAAHLHALELSSAHEQVTVGVANER